MSSRSVWLIAGTLSAGMHAGVAVIAGALPASAARTARATSIVRLEVRPTSPAGPRKPAPRAARARSSSAGTPAAPPAADASVAQQPDAVTSNPSGEPAIAVIEAGGTAPGSGGDESGAGLGATGSGGPGGSSASDAGSSGASSTSCVAAISAELNARLANDMPRAVRVRGLQGEVVLSFVIEAPRQTPRARVEQSSGHAFLDQAALALLAAPLRTPCTGRHIWRVRLKRI